MSRSMQRLREQLSEKLGPSYARVRIVWLCQAFNVTPLDEVPAAMYNAINGTR